jgi:hypothetical protein
MTHKFPENKLFLHYSVKTPQEMDFSTLISAIQTMGEISEFSVGE